MTATAVPRADWRNLGAALTLHAAAMVCLLQFSQTSENFASAPVIMASLLSESPNVSERAEPRTEQRIAPPAAARPARMPETPVMPAVPVRAITAPVLMTQNAAATETVPLVPAKPAPTPAAPEIRQEKQETAKPAETPVVAKADAPAEKTATASGAPAASHVSAAAPSPSPAARDSELQSYLAALMRRLARFKVYPAALKKDKVEGRVVLSFTIGANGQLIASAVQKSSGHPELDQAALEMLSRANPLPAVPASMHRNELSLSIPVEYSLIKDQ